MAFGTSLKTRDHHLTPCACPPVCHLPGRFSVRTYVGVLAEPCCNSSWICAETKPAEHNCRPIRWVAQGAFHLAEYKRGTERVKESKSFHVWVGDPRISKFRKDFSTLENFFWGGVILHLKSECDWILLVASTHSLPTRTTCEQCWLLAMQLGQLKCEGFCWMSIFNCQRSLNSRKLHRWIGM